LASQRDIIFQPLRQTMTAITVFDKKGKKSSKDHKLNDDLFGLEPNMHLLYLAQVRQEANGRNGNAHTKTRPEVRGGGAKPWRQKGTGRARAGSIRSPLWRGGGVIFGPRNNVNWKKGMNNKESVRSLLSALVLVQQQNRLSAIEDLTVQEAKTKELAAITKETGIDIRNQSLLYIVEADHAQLELLLRAAANLVNVELISTSNLNVKALLKADNVVVTTKALEQLEKRFNGVLESAKAAA